MPRRRATDCATSPCPGSENRDRCRRLPLQAGRPASSLRNRPADGEPRRPSGLHICHPLWSCQGGTISPTGGREKQGRQDSNLRRPVLETGALTELSYAPVCLVQNNREAARSLSGWAASRLALETIRATCPASRCHSRRRPARRGACRPRAARCTAMIRGWLSVPLPVISFVWVPVVDGKCPAHLRQRYFRARVGHLPGRSRTCADPFSGAGTWLSAGSVAVGRLRVVFLVLVFGWRVRHRT